MAGACCGTAEDDPVHVRAERAGFERVRRRSGRGRDGAERQAPTEGAKKFCAIDVEWTPGVRSGDTRAPRSAVLTKIV